MRTYAQKQPKSQQAKSVDPARPSAVVRRRDVYPILYRQRRIGSQTTERLLQADHDGLEPVSDAPASTRFSHDFSRIPLHAKTPVAIQSKLAVNTPGDIYEQEADRVSEHVVGMPEVQLQHACTSGEGCPKTKQLGQDQERLETKRIGSSDVGQSVAPSSVHEVLASPGLPLDIATRSFMEPRFGHDFSMVRVHSGEGAEASAMHVNAFAYTVGHNIVFGTGRFAPWTHEGRRLLSHELTHVMQQNGGIATIQRSPADDVRWKQSVRAARYRGQLMANRIRRHGKLSRDARAKINEELAYFEGDAKVTYLHEVQPILSAVVEIEMPAMEARPERAKLEPAKPEPAKPGRTEQGVPHYQEGEYDAMAAFYASERESQLEAAAAEHAKFREGVHNMTAQQIYSQWEAEKDNFIAVASSANHALNKMQLLEIWRLHWGDRWKAAQSSLMQIKNLKPEERSAAHNRAESEEELANFMLRSIVLAHGFLISAEDQGKHVTFDELNKAAVELETFHEHMVAAAGMILPGGGLGIGRGAPMTEHGVSPRYEPPTRLSESPSGGGTSAENAGSGPGEIHTGDQPPAARPAQTIKSSPPPPPQQGSTPGGPMPITDVDIVKANVNSPSSIKPQQPNAHQVDWNTRGGAGIAPPAYRDSEGNVHVSTDHPLMGEANRGGIPPVSPGARTQSAPKPSRSEPGATPVPAKQRGDIGHADTGQAPPPAKPAADPMAKTPAAPQPAKPAPAPPKPVSPGAKTGEAAAESRREQANRGQIPPPQAISEEGVERIRNQPRSTPAPRKGAGNNVNYSTDHDKHQLAWQRVGGHGDSPPAFIYDGQVYLDPSRWPPGPR
jgi:Domain of unknown function (DUF4157)